jgi:GT2 family glycosyltransferase
METHVSSPKVSIVILNHDGLGFLKICIPSVKKQTYKNLEILVVDNASQDGSQKYVRGLKGILLIANDDNYGYAKANNIGAEAASGEFLFFVNNDTELKSDTVALLMASHQEKSILGPLQLIPLGKDKYRKLYQSGMDIFGYPFGERPTNKTRPFYIDGAAVFIKKKDFIDIGMFDEELFIFQEDIDFSWRAQLYGYKILPCPESVLVHFSGGDITGGSIKSNKYTSSYFRRYMNEKNVIRNMLKNYSLVSLLLLLPLLVGAHFVEVLFFILLGKFKIARCYVQAYNWNIRNFKSTLEFRHAVQKRRVKGDFYVFMRAYKFYSKVIALKRIGLPRFE